MNARPRSTTLVLVPLAALATAMSATGQCRPSTGVFVATPIALSVAEDRAGSSAIDELLFKERGFLTVPPQPWTDTPGLPSFRMLPMFRLCGLRQGPFPDIDAMSIGEDWILADDVTGRVAVPSNRWGGLVFSVTPGTAGRPGSVIAEERRASGGAAADLFSWVLPGSALPTGLVGRTARAQDSSEIDLGSRPPDVDALDLFAPVWGQASGMRSTLIDPPQVFFSVSHATLDRVPAAWWANQPRSAATILTSTWSRRLQRWSCPQPWMSFRELRLQQSEDLDALAVDLRNQRLLFSTKSSTRDPILFLYYGTDSGVAVPLTDPTGVPVSTVIGLTEDDDIDAICAMDPSLRGSQTGPNSSLFAMGTPLPKMFGFPAAELQSSAFRGFDGVDEDICSFMSGWPSTGQGAGQALFALSVGGGLLPVALHPRNPANPICGDPLEHRLKIPPSAPPRWGRNLTLLPLVTTCGRVSTHGPTEVEP